MATEVHGPEFDPSTTPIDAEIVMRVGGGKKHVRYYVADSSINPVTTPNLSQIQARSTSSSPVIRSRPDSTDVRMAALNVISVSLIFTYTMFCIVTLESNFASPDGSRVPSMAGGPGGEVVGRA